MIVVTRFLVVYAPLEIQSWRTIYTRDSRQKLTEASKSRQKPIEACRGNRQKQIEAGRSFKTAGDT